MFVVGYSYPMFVCEGSIILVGPFLISLLVNNQNILWKRK